MWTQERKGALSRELLFDPLGTNERRALSVTRLLQLHMGMFMFLCEVMCAFMFNIFLTPRNVTFLFRKAKLLFWPLLFCRNVLTVSLASLASEAKRISLYVPTSLHDIPLTITSESSPPDFCLFIPRCIETWSLGCRKIILVIHRIISSHTFVSYNAGQVPGARGSLSKRALQ